MKRTLLAASLSLAVLSIGTLNAYAADPTTPAERSENRQADRQDNRANRADTRQANRANRQKDRQTNRANRQDTREEDRPK